MSFNKVKNLLNGGNENVIRKALSRSTVLELSEDQNKVRRKENAPVKSQEEIDECTVSYCRSHCSLIQLLSFTSCF